MTSLDISPLVVRFLAGRYTAEDKFGYSAPSVGFKTISGICGLPMVMNRTRVVFQDGMFISDFVTGRVAFGGVLRIEE